jgi:hypothetical protein
MSTPNIKRPFSVEEIGEANLREVFFIWNLEIKRIEFRLAKLQYRNCLQSSFHPLCQL